MPLVGHEYGSAVPIEFVTVPLVGYEYGSAVEQAFDMMANKP